MKFLKTKANLFKDSSKAHHTQLCGNGWIWIKHIIYYVIKLQPILPWPLCFFTLTPLTARSRSLAMGVVEFDKGKSCTYLVLSVDLCYLHSYLTYFNVLIWWCGSFKRGRLQSLELSIQILLVHVPYDGWLLRKSISVALLLQVLQCKSSLHTCFHIYQIKFSQAVIFRVLNCSEKCDIFSACHLELGLLSLWLIQ